MEIKLNQPAKNGATWRTTIYVGRATFLFVILSALAYSFIRAAEIKVFVGAFLYWIQGLGGWGVFAMFAAYAVATVLFIPTTLLNLGAGYSFGVWIGFPCIIAAGTTGAAISFFLGQTLARDCVTSCFWSYSAHLRRVDQVLLQGRGAWQFVFLSRVPPCMPFPVMSYLYGTTGVPFLTYITATAAGLCPGSFMYVYIGHTLRTLSDLLSGNPKILSLHFQVVLVLGVAMTVLVSFYLANQARLVAAGQDANNMNSEGHDEEMGLVETDTDIGKPSSSWISVEEDGFFHWFANFDARAFVRSMVSSLWP